MNYSSELIKLAKIELEQLNREEAALRDDYDRFTEQARISSSERIKIEQRIRVLWSLINNTPLKKEERTIGNTD